MKGTRIQQMFRQIVTLVFMVCRLWRKIPGGATAREDPAHNPRNGPFRPTPAALSSTMFSGELAHKLTWTKRRLQLGRRAQLRRRVHHHQCRPRQCSRQGPATGGRDEQDDTSCVTLQDRRRFFHFFHLKLETDGQGDHGRSTLIPVLQEAEFSRRGPRDRGRDGGTHWRRGDSGLNQARTRNVRVAQQGSKAFIEQRRPQEPAVMCGQEGRNAARASCTQRRHKKSRRRSSDRQRTGLAATGRLRTG